MSSVGSLQYDFGRSQAAPALGADRWHAVYTYPRHERSVHDELTARAVEVFLPCLKRQSRWKDRVVQLEVPLFPSYVFARIEPGQRSRVLGAAGVARILSFNGQPAPIADSEIEAVRLCLAQGMTCAPCSEFELGDSVRVCSGVLAGLEGKISRCKNRSRLIIPVSLIHQSIAVEVDVEHLELIASTRLSPAVHGVAGGRHLQS